MSTSSNEDFEDFCAENEDRCRSDFEADCAYVPQSQRPLAWFFYLAGWMHSAYRADKHLLELVKLIGPSDGDATDMSNKLVALRRLLAHHLP